MPFRFGRCPIGELVCVEMTTDVAEAVEELLLAEAQRARYDGTCYTLRRLPPRAASEVLYAAAATVRRALQRAERATS